MIKATDAYKRRCPEKYMLAQEVRRCCALKIEQFPEACCIDASHVLSQCSPDLQVVCGSFKNAKMKRRALHVWIFDTAERVHIDLTADQFPTAFGRDVVVMPQTPRFMKDLGYALTDLDTMDELYAGPYRHFGDLGKTNITRDTTLLDIAKCSKVIMRAIKRRA